MGRAFHKGLSRRLIDALSRSGIKRGIGPSQRYLLTVTGRKTHIPRSTPVSLIVDGSSRYLVAPYGEVDWVRNARSAGVVTLTRGDASEQFSLKLLPAGEAAPILKRYVNVEPVTRPYVNVPPDAPDRAFEGEAASHPVFILSPIN